MEDNEKKKKINDNRNSQPGGVTPRERALRNFSYSRMTF